MSQKKFSKVFLEKTYINIFKESQKVTITSFNITALTKSERRFQILLYLLFFKYNIIKDVINTENNSNLEKSIQKL